ncbi:MAG: helix-turn-helix domain-containing protein [Pelosinus sp.]|nr:helix-turn-helix domain-containing protein [Pelosinus sp.]
MPNIYGPFLKGIRVKRGIKAAYVARRILVSPPTYSQIESGARGLSAERLDGILKALGLLREELDAVMGAAKDKAGKKRGGAR